MARMDPEKAARMRALLALSAEHARGDLSNADYDRRSCAIIAPQLDIFGGETTLAAPAERQPEHARAEQPRLFEPQYEGQLPLADNPEDAPEGAER